MSITTIISKAAQHKDTYIEDLVPLRVVTTGLAITGVLAAGPLTEAPLWLVALSIGGSILGSYVSYKRRYQNNLVVKIFLSVGIIIAAVLFFNEIIVLANQNVADARVPLTKLLMVLVALHCFDVPRRRDLSVSFLVGFTLMTAASTLSRELVFAAYLFVFMALTVIMFQFDCASRSLVRAKTIGADASNLEQTARKFSGTGGQRKRFSPAVIQACIALAIFSVSSLGIFLVAPKVQLNLNKEFRLGLNLPFQIQSDFLNKLSENGAGATKGIVHPEDAYFGFAEEFDTNYRGRLSDTVVLRVLSKIGLNLRGMAYDNFDGKIWRMTRPKETQELLARDDHGFNLDLKLTPFRRVYNTTITQMFYVEQDSSNLIVTASSPYQLYFPGSSIQVDTYGALRAPVGMQKDMVYSAFSQVPIYDYRELRALSDSNVLRGRPWKLEDTEEQNYLQVPPMLDPGVAKLAQKISGKGNNFARAERMCRFLQTHYDYDLEIAETPANRDSVSDFLLYSHRGFCEHFASALTIMCRTQQIPARLVTGYTCGQYNPFTGFWEVRLRDAHSWVEVFSPRFGWIPLDATPNAPALYGEEPQSAFSYLQQILKPLWNAIWNSAFVQSANAALLQLFSSVLNSCFIAFVWVKSHPALNFVGALLALGTLLYLTKGTLLSKLSHFSASTAKRGRNQLLVNTEASKEYVKLNQSLQEFGVVREYSETPTDLLEKTRLALKGSGSEEQEFLQKLAEFLELYSQIRFGGDSSDLPKLKNLNLNIAEMSKNLSQT